MLAMNHNVASFGIQVLSHLLKVTAVLRGPGNRLRNSVIESTFVRRMTWLYFGTSLRCYLLRASTVDCLITETFLYCGTEPQGLGLRAALVV